MAQQDQGSHDSVESKEDLFSYKRFFINNADSYHGEAILAEVAKICQERNNVVSEKQSVKSIIGEEVMEREPTPPPVLPWEIIATVSDPAVKKLDNVSRIITKEECISNVLTCGTVIWDISYCQDELNSCLEYMKLSLYKIGALIITADMRSFSFSADKITIKFFNSTVLNLLLEKQSPDPDVAREAGGDAPAVDITKKRTMILISTVMTWAATKPLDPESPELPFIETDFRKRKPHPNYKLYYDCENEVIAVARKYRSQIGATVIGIGITYGGKEDLLYYWFQKVWECEHLIPILGRGSNVIPLINVQDLAQIVYNFIIDFPRKLYMLGVEQNITKQREIIKPLGRQIGTGMFKCIPQEDAFLIPEMNQRTYDLMTVNLPMEPTFIVETMNLNWVSEMTFAENVPVLMKQFRKGRGLRCFKVVLYGPPLVGKTTLAKNICKNYGLIYVSAETVVQDLIEDYTWRIQQWETGEMATLGLPMGAEDEDPAAGSVGDDAGEEEAAQEAARTTLAILQSGRPLMEEEMIAYMRQRLLSREAQNRGWVLDGYLNTLLMCAALFEKGEEEDEVEEEHDENDQFEEDLELYSNVLKKMLPDLVVSLVATDDFICDKAMRLPDAGSRLNEENTLRRLSEFRTVDTIDLSPLNFFDELDIHPLIVKVDDHKDYPMLKAYKEVSLRMGRPCKYPALLAVIEAAEKIEQQEIEAKRALELKARQELEKKMKEEREDRMEYWSNLYALLREEEEAALAAASDPMRNYLISHIFPTLTPALLEVAKLRPEDPIDFLAEYLFKLNPSGRMLEPGYNLQAEIMLGRVKLMDEALKTLDLVIEPLLPPEVEDADPNAEKKEINPMSAF